MAVRNRENHLFEHLATLIQSAHPSAQPMCVVVVWCHDLFGQASQYGLTLHTLGMVTVSCTKLPNDQGACPNQQVDAE
jgi:hypothetical protein